VRDFQASQDGSVKVQKIIEVLIQDFAYSVSPNSRNGGLIGLAATAFALGQEDLKPHLTEIIPPVLACLGDQDARVRYYACEAMYNIAKVARSDVLIFFNEVFDHLSKLSADSEISVKNGADLLDRLIKDIVTEHSQHTEKDDIDPLQNPVTKFDLKAFIPLLAERIYAVNPFTRSFLISWVTVLDSVPELELISYLPEFLDGLLGFVSDANEDVKMNASNILAEFLKEIREIALHQTDFNPLIDETDDLFNTAKLTLKENNEEVVETGTKSTRNISIPFAKLITILLPHTRPLADERTKHIALSWLGQFVILAGDVALSIASDLISSVLTCLAHPSPSIRRESEICDRHLRRLVTKMVKEEKNATDEDLQKYIPKLDFESTVNALTLLFLNEHEKTRVVAIEWLLMLHKKSPRRVISTDSGTFPALLKTLTDQSELVVKKDLELLAQISFYSGDEYFSKIISSLLSLFSTDRNLLEARGSLIVRQLCIHLDSEWIFKTFAEILDAEEDLEFAGIMVQTLNLILVTASEASELRYKLRDIGNQNSLSLFTTLYKSWCHNAVSALSLCLICQSYDHASALLQMFTELDISVSLLVQLDKLVQLLESPVFTYLRLQLLEPNKYPSLYKCLYGLLMLLPQSSAFATLRNRLNSVSSLGYLHVAQMAGSSASPQLVKNRKSQNGTDDASRTEVLLLHFRKLQTKHQNHRKPTNG
jgi:vacuole morphology and inheritance protein 14